MLKVKKSDVIISNLTNPVKYYIRFTLYYEPYLITAERKSDKICLTNLSDNVIKTIILNNTSYIIKYKCFDHILLVVTRDVSYHILYFYHIDLNNLKNINNINPIVSRVEIKSFIEIHAINSVVMWGLNNEYSILNFINNHRSNLKLQPNHWNIIPDSDYVIGIKYIINNYNFVLHNQDNTEIYSLSNSTDYKETCKITNQLIYCINKIYYVLLNYTIDKYKILTLVFQKVNLIKFKFTRILYRHCLINTDKVDSLNIYNNLLIINCHNKIFGMDFHTQELLINYSFNYKNFTLKIIDSNCWLFCKDKLVNKVLWIKKTKKWTPDMFSRLPKQNKKEINTLLHIWNLSISSTSCSSYFSNYYLGKIPIEIIHLIIEWIVFDLFIWI